MRYKTFYVYIIPINSVEERFFEGVTPTIPKTSIGKDGSISELDALWLMNRWNRLASVNKPINYVYYVD